VRISDSDSFIDLCKNYRIAVYIFTSILYILVEDFYSQIAIQNFLIIIGMGIACFLGNYMYDALEEQVVLTRLTLVFELFAYGIFVYTSGGFSSTYLWYYVCCLLVVMNRKEDFSFIFFGSAWCLFCAWSGISDFDTILRLKLNIVAGVGMTLGSFFILKINFDIGKLKIGDFIEFEGELQKNPLIEFLNAFVDIYKLVDIFSEESHLGNKSKAKTQEKVNQKIIKQIKSFSDELKHSGTIDFILSSEQGDIVLSTQEQYLSNDNISEILGGTFKVLGKVIAICEDDSNNINLLRKTTLSLLPEELLEEVFAGFKSDEMEQFNLPEFKTKIKGPAMIVIPIAIYS